MQDNFKDHINDNLNEFQFEFDADKGWQDFNKRRSKGSNNWVWMVAASLALLVSAVIVFNSIKEQPSEELSEWQEVEQFYESQINQMTVLVSSLAKDNDILYDLEEMDRAFEEVKADLSDDMASEEVIEAMMMHYRLKLDILEKMLEEIRKNDEEEISSRL